MSAAYKEPPMDSIAVPAGTYDLGWRYTDRLPQRVADSLREIGMLAAEMPWFSPMRRVTLPAFEVAREAIPIGDLIGDAYDLDPAVNTLQALCDLVDARLARDGRRLPTEDELEAACGGELFAWGMTVPDGLPMPGETSFDGHTKPNARGLKLNGNPYRVELVRHALKLGDGGRSICGGEAWPLAWFALAPCFRLRDEDMADCFVETLEEAYVRPVRVG
jgi:hypothetical protein